ncbi:MAG: AraC family transcriptional regulator [Clostridiaceae bacterium]
MIKSLKNIICLRSMFSKLIACFILIILIISSFHMITNRIYRQNMENEITKNVSENFNKMVKEFEQCFDDVKNKLLQDFFIEYSDILKLPKSHNYDNLLMIRKMNKYLLVYPYLEDFVVYIKGFDYVITVNGTFEKDAYFSRFYKSNYYTEDFWLEEMKKNFMFKVYAEKEFSLQDTVYQSTTLDLMPIVLKNVTNSQFLLTAFIDVDQFTGSLDKDFFTDFFIYDENGDRIYPDDNSLNGRDEFLAMTDIAENKTSYYQKVDNGYLFTYKSYKNSLTYCKFYPDTIIRDQINETNRLMTLIIITAMLISTLLSVYIVKKFNNPVKSMYQLIKDSKSAKDTGTDVIDLKNIKDRVAGIVSQNTNYAKDINEKDSLLKNYFWQTKLKNIILNPNESGKNQVEYPNYAVVLFKIHYRNAYYLHIAKEINEGTYVLKDLIHVYIYEQFNDAVTFQMDEKQIVSIVGVKKDIITIRDYIDKVAQKLTNEDEFVYFTIAYSEINYSSSELHEVYERVLGALKYRKLVEKTQILSERTINKKLDGFYFSKDQREQFTNLLENGKKEECIQLINSIFDYNIKKETNELCIYLLFVDVVDCCSNVLLQLYNEIPANLPLTNEYYHQEHCESVSNYRIKYEFVISECVDYINKNQKQTDYIIDYVKNYINENYSKDISVDILADKLKISRTYLSRYFKNNTGMNLSDYLNTFRMKKACTLLQNSMLMVKDIAPQVGIYNISTFMRLFKSYTGKTPNDYRKSNIQ